MTISPSEDTLGTALIVPALRLLRIISQVFFCRRHCIHHKMYPYEPKSKSWKTHDVTSNDVKRSPTTKTVLVYDNVHFVTESKGTRLIKKDFYHATLNLPHWLPYWSSICQKNDWWQNQRCRWLHLRMRMVCPCIDHQEHNSSHQQQSCHFTKLFWNFQSRHHKTLFLKKHQKNI